MCVCLCGCGHNELYIQLCASVRKSDVDPCYRCISRLFPFQELFLGLLSFSSVVHLFHHISITKGKLRSYLFFCFIELGSDLWECVQVIGDFSHLRKVSSLSHGARCVCNYPKPTLPPPFSFALWTVGLEIYFHLHLPQHIIYQLSLAGCITKSNTQGILLSSTLGVEFSFSLLWLQVC